MKTKNSQKTKNPSAREAWILRKRQGRLKQYWTGKMWAHLPEDLGIEAEVLFR